MGKDALQQVQAVLARAANLQDAAEHSKRHSKKFKQLPSGVSDDDIRDVARVAAKEMNLKPKYVEIALNQLHPSEEVIKTMRAELESERSVRVLDEEFREQIIQELRTCLDNFHPYQRFKFSRLKHAIYLQALTQEKSFLWMKKWKEESTALALDYEEKEGTFRITKVYVRDPKLFVHLKDWLVEKKKQFPKMQIIENF